MEDKVLQIECKTCGFLFEYEGGVPETVSYCCPYCNTENTQKNIVKEW